MHIPQFFLFHMIIFPSELSLYWCFWGPLFFWLCLHKGVGVLFDGFFFQLPSFDLMSGTLRKSDTGINSFSKCFLHFAKMLSFPSEKRNALGVATF